MLGLLIGTVLAGGVAEAATGGTFLLGRSNSATTLTKLTSTRGTALSLVSPSKSPPLAVSNSRKVARFNADLLDGLDSRSLQRHFQRTIVVSPGTSATAAGNALKAALSHISSTNTTPYLVQLEPGTYDLGSSSLRLKPNVAVAGSGPGVTSITSAVDAGHFGPPYVGTVNLVPHSSLSRVSVFNTSTNTSSESIVAAVDSSSSGVVSLREVNLYAFAGNSSGDYGLLFNDGSAFLLADDIEIRAPASSGFGLDGEAGTLKVRNSLLAAGGYAVINSGTSTVLVATSEVDGDKFGSPTCVDSFNSSYTAISTGCF